MIIGTIVLCVFLFTMIWVDKYILEPMEEENKE